MSNLNYINTENKPLTEFLSTLLAKLQPTVKNVVAQKYGISHITQSALKKLVASKKLIKSRKQTNKPSLMEFLSSLIAKLQPTVKNVVAQQYGSRHSALKQLVASRKVIQESRKQMNKPLMEFLSTLTTRVRSNKPESATKRTRGQLFERLKKWVAQGKL